MYLSWHSLSVVDDIEYKDPIFYVFISPVLMNLPVFVH